MSELIVQNNTPIISSDTQAVLSMIERVVLNPEADMEKLEKMLDLQERILNRNAKQAFTADLAAMQAELPLVGKAGEGHNKAKYAKLEDINEAIRPTLQKYGFAVTFRTKQTDKTLTVIAILSHKLGHSEDTDLILPLDTSGSKNAVQAVGSTISYGKRYSLCALLNISTGDDNDGNLPPQNNSEQQVQKTPIADDILDFAISEINARKAPLSKLLNFHEFTPTQKQKIKAAFPQVQL
jgi:hypothetical protein